MERVDFLGGGRKLQSLFCLFYYEIEALSPNKQTTIGDPVQQVVHNRQGPAKRPKSLEYNIAINSVTYKIYYSWKGLTLFVRTKCIAGNFKSC